MSERPKIFGNLVAEVIRKNTCVTCGGCEAVCPVNTIKIEDGTPKLVGLCISCQLCYWNCPVASFNVTEMEETTGERINENRAKEAVETGAKTIGVSCPFCMTMMTDGLKALNKEEDVAVLELTELVAKRVE